MLRFLPLVLAVVAIGSLTVVEGLKTERWANNSHASYCVTLLEDVPKQMGSWEGVDGEVDDSTRETAGARSYVSRNYTNAGTGQTVNVWLIVGHARDTARHTPDICYQANGFKPQEDQKKVYLTLPDGRKASFYTNLFEQEGMRTRVFWTWFKPEQGAGRAVDWKAPDNVRYEIGAAPALYKLYFTVSGRDAIAGGDESLAMEFAEEFIQLIDPLLQKANQEVPEGFDPSTVEEV